MRQLPRIATGELALALLCLGLLSGKADREGTAVLQGDCYVHDPSTIVRCKHTYWLFATGPGCSSRYSSDRITWQSGPPVFTTLPDWVREAVPANRGFVWAPDIVFRKGRYYLYYSVSRFGRNTSVIGLATSPTLDPSDPAYRWTDQGVVIRSAASDNYNAIDPCPFQDADGKLWLAFGSFWSGIKLVQLDAATGRRASDPSPIYALATHPGSTAIEAPYLYYHRGYYYLFVNWDFCCRGVNSTYNIRVGRSRAVTGPYLDREGIEMGKGGGTLFLETSGDRIGPGCIGIFKEKGKEWFSCHYYDGKANGRPTLDIQPLAWSRDGWPSPGKEPASR
jgi:arabinan endo-1,5-alpha-L-arabinosidase